MHCHISIWGVGISCHLVPNRKLLHYKEPVWHWEHRYYSFPAFAICSAVPGATLFASYLSLWLSAVWVQRSLWDDWQVLRQVLDHLMREHDTKAVHLDFWRGGDVTCFGFKRRDAASAEVMQLLKGLPDVSIKFLVYFSDFVLLFLPSEWIHAPITAPAAASVVWGTPLLPCTVNAKPTGRGKRVTSRTAWLTVGHLKEAVARTMPASVRLIGKVGWQRSHWLADVSLQFHIHCAGLSVIKLASAFSYIHAKYWNKFFYSRLDSGSWI